MNNIQMNGVNAEALEGLPTPQAIGPQGRTVSIRTATVEIRTLTVSGRQVTQALFKQLPTKECLDSNLCPIGDWWGMVRYEEKGYENFHWPILFESESTLYKGYIKDRTTPKAIADLTSKLSTLTAKWVTLVWITRVFNYVSGISEKLPESLDNEYCVELEISLLKSGGKRKGEVNLRRFKDTASMVSAGPDYYLESYHPRHSSPWSRYQDPILDENDRKKKWFDDIEKEFMVVGYAFGDYKHNVTNLVNDSLELERQIESLNTNYTNSVALANSLEQLFIAV